MPSRKVGVGIVTRVMLLIVATLVLVAGGELYNGMHLRQARLAALSRDALQLSRIAALNMDGILQGSDRLLATLSKLPALGLSQACSVALATANDDFEYDHIVLEDLNGR